MGETTATAEAKLQIPTFGRDKPVPGAYNLDLEPVWAAPVRLNGQPSTFGEVYCKLRDSKVEKMPQYISEEYVTGEGVVRLECDWPFGHTMRELIEVTWFYYENDWSRDADERYSFFAVHDGKIIMESVSFSWRAPRVLKRREADAEPIWQSHPYLDEAWERYWYRKFYAETMTGQLMVLRTDKPILYHYERPEDREAARAVELVTLAKIYRLLLVVIPLLAAVAFPSTREYAAAAAAGLGGAYLLICWRTRKVGSA
jgi:hypothetical protein